MIQPESYSKEWIYGVRGRSTADPGLIEKVIYALTLLEQLQMSGLDFVFKGGTALILLFGEPQRLSIDIDIVVHPAQKDSLQAAVDAVMVDGVFVSVEEQLRGTARQIPKAHYKFFYRSIVSGKDEPLLLDVLFEESPYTCVEELPICGRFVKCEGENVLVRIPSVNCILGDKLTAFAPNTTGIPYDVDKELEIIKQLFDIAQLFDRMNDVEAVQANFDVIARQEIEYRKQEIGIEDVACDTLETALVLSLRGQRNAERYAQLEAGVKKLRPFIFTQPFQLDIAIRCSAKAAYLSSLRLANRTDVERFVDAASVAGLLIEHPDYNKLNRLKKTDPEAFYYWYKAVELLP